MTLSPALAVMRAAHGDRVPEGRLGADTVPPAALALPIELATEELVKHAKTCPDVRCQHVPPPLGNRRGVRPDKIRTARHEVHKLLWKYPDHDLVDFVRDEIRSENKELVEQISSGSLLEGETLSSFLRDQGEAGLRRLAAVLWASRFDGPDAEELFRFLVPLADGNSAPGSRQGAAHVGEEKKLKRELRKTSREYRETKRNSELAEKSLQRKERELEKLRAEYRAEKKEHRKVVEEVERVREQIRKSDAARIDIERDLDKAERFREDTQREHRRLDREKGKLAAERSDLARQLATKELRVKELESRLGDLPRGDQAVQHFLREEEERIKRDRLILSGSPKARADEEWRLHRKLKAAFLDAYPKFRVAAPKKLRRKTSLRFVALGGSAEIGRSCYLIELGERRILVDCGIKPGGSSGFHPGIDGLERVDALIVTHAHTDHIGWIPALVNRFGELDIFCSPATRALFPVMLEDGHSHYVRQLAIRSEQAQHIANAGEVVAGYGGDDVRRVPGLALACEFGSEKALPFPGASIRFFPAGHILGAASLLIEEETGRRVFFSGDFSSFPQLTVPAAIWPEDLGEIDLLVLESTYGNSKHQEPESTRAELVDFIRDTTENRKGSVILPSFALGRAQELLKLILRAKEEGDLRDDVPVFVDGMIKSINPVYREYSDFDLPQDAVLEVHGETDRDEIAREAQKIPSIIVTTSGMLTGGPVVEYARHLLPDARHRIVLTGYQDEGAPSRALLDISGSGGPRVVRLQGEGGEIKFKAAMPAKQFGLSAHADRPGLLEYASMLKPKQIVLVHGAPWQQQDLSKGLALSHPRAEISCGPDQVEVG